MSVPVYLKNMMYELAPKKKGVREKPLKEEGFFRKL